MRAASVASERTRRAPSRRSASTVVLSRYEPCRNYAALRTRPVHAPGAARLVSEGLCPVLDVGCGEGELQRHLPDGAWVGVDASPTMVAGAPAGAQLARADALPFAARGLVAAPAPSRQERGLVRTRHPGSRP